MTRPPVVICSLLVVLGGASLSGQGLKAQYQAILKPAITSTAVAENANLELDGIEMHFVQGELGWGAPLNGQPTALVFSGQGWLQISLPNRIERQQVKLFSGSAQLRFTFKAAVFRFASTQRLQTPLLAQAHFREAHNSTALTRVLADRDKFATETGRGAPVRILDALADNPAPPWAAELLLAQFERSDGSWVDVDVDPLEPNPLRVYTIKTRTLLAVPLSHAMRGTTADHDALGPLLPINSGPLRQRFQSTWTALAPAGLPSYPPPWVAFGYGITVHLTPAPDLAASEAVALRSTSGHRGIFLRLDGKYRVLSAHALGKPLDFLQAPDPTNFGYPDRYAGNWLYVRWPEPLHPGDRVELTLEVERKGAFQVGARVFYWLHSPDQAWYPMIPFGGATPRARFHVLFAKTDGLHTDPLYTAHWDEDLPGAPMTGFGWLAGGDPAPITVNLPGGAKLTLEGMPPSFAQKKYVGHTILLQMEDALRLFTRLFGALPLHWLVLPIDPDPSRYSPVTGRLTPSFPALLNNLPSSWPTPAPTAGIFGREVPSWPGMLPTNGWWEKGLFGVPFSLLNESSVTMPSRLDLADIAPEHSLVHQWWGDWVGWTSYQDSWLGEALANGSAIIFAAHEGGDKTAGAIRQDWLRELTHKDIFGHIPNHLGPLCLGPRLASALDPAGYGLVAQDKGGYVIEMLRAMMGEARFAAAMHALTREYGGRNISVAEFEQLMAVHMSPAMDLGHDGTLRWFFDEYVQHRTIPTLAVSWKTHGQTTDVTIANPQDWRGLLPVYLFRDATHAQRALVPVTAAATRATLSSPFTPVRIAADPWHEMLITLVGPK